MSNAHYAHTVNGSVTTLLLLVAVYACTNVTHSAEPRLAEPTNHEIVVDTMTDDLLFFRMCAQQATMLAQQTADFGVLGLMTTVAAIGISTDPAKSVPHLGRESYGGSTDAVGILSAQSE